MTEQTTRRPRRRFKPYPAYKQSGIKWLGEIPAGWDVRRLKTLISHPITDGPHETPKFLTSGVPFLSVDGIQEGELVFDGCRYISEADHRDYQRKCAPRRDDILIGKAASTGKIARVKVNFEFSVWSPLALIRPDNAEMWPGFLEYSLKSTATQAQIEVLCTSNTQKNISMRDIPLLVVSVACLREQHAIAAFLDRETARIDALVAKKERLIELLQEKRIALITRAVTKGLDPNIPMKDSGVEWLGEIPAHWEVKPFTRCIVEKSDYRGRTPEKVSSGVFLVTARNVRMGLIDYESSQEFISMDEYEEIMKRGLPKKGDLLFTTEAPLGNVALVDREDIALAQRIIRFRMNAIHFDSRFALFALMSD